ncbi:hypothetical protein D3C71_1417420 [compost metagenome]
MHEQALSLGRIGGQRVAIDELTEDLRRAIECPIANFARNRRQAVVLTGLKYSIADIPSSRSKGLSKAGVKR